ncbi:hypothetical protein BOX15_Mlig017824g1 [Macrostomum lignano]|uniref:TIR domain-containing protein n=1 Tax=Macrostomum lignano TaxID=282301 RepID=A0A267F586_9PLAT|nr:hypothetical protein BOX15_Mlig017824g1 [Macrostomum lignano]
MQAPTESLILLLACTLTALLPAAAAAQPQLDDDLNKYIILPKNFSLTHECCCENMMNSPRFDYFCQVSEKPYPNASCMTGWVDCSDLPGRIVYSLTINCTSYPSVTVNLRALTVAHNSSSIENEISYPPQLVHLVNCNVNGFEVGILELPAENVSLDYGMEVAPFGSPDRPGVGGYYTVNVTYPREFRQADCWMVELNIENASTLWYLPSYLCHKCNSLKNIFISNSPIEWISIRDVLSLHNVRSFSLTHSRLKYFASDALSTAIKLLDRYLEAGVQTGCINDTEAAIKALNSIRSRTGRLSSPTQLYDTMGTANIDFTLLFGYRLRSAFSGNKTEPACDMPGKMALTDLDLSFNALTDIPFSISMFDQLNRVNLSHNRIRSLYHGWMCWYPPVPENQKNTSNRHCYWFRAARASLKVLDLSFNEINMIGEIQPWHQVALSYLILRGNRIMSVNPDAFAYSPLATSLLNLYLDENLLSYFHLECLTRLEVLSLEGCRIANIEQESLPKSKSLREINLDSNRIFAIAPGVFEQLEKLEFVRLHHNRLMHFYANSFKTPPRSTLASRVIIHIANQSDIPICDCSHVYKKILQDEEFGNPQKSYVYPRILPEDMSTECQFFSRFSSTRVVKKLSESNQSEFLCEFQDNQKHKLPWNYCNENVTIMGREKCFVKCIYGCRCYHDDGWDISDLDCTPGNSTVTTDLVKMRFEFPIKYMFMAGLKDSEFFRHVSKGSFKWLNESDSNELLFLQLNNSNVKYVEKDAFANFENIVVIYLHDNNITSINPSPFIGNCFLNKNLNQITLHNNRMNYIDPAIINGTCPVGLSGVSLSGNPWHCSCHGKWIELHKTLIQDSRKTQTVSDFRNMYCTIDASIVGACTENRENLQWSDVCQNANDTANYPVADEGRLVKVCELIADSAVQQRRQIVRMILTSVFGLALLGVAMLAVRRRHRLLAVVRVLILLKYQSSRRLQQQASRDSLPYDAMLWASDRDQDCLVDVLNCVRSASGGDELELCVPESFLYSDLCSCPLTYFDCPAEGAKFSGKVVVALSERFLDTQYLALCQVIRELDSLGRNPFKDIVFLRLSSRRVSLQRQRQLGPEDVEAFHTLQRILAESDIEYKSVDWEYRLIERIRNRDPAAVLLLDRTAELELPTAAAGGSERPAATATAELPDLPDDEQALIVDVEQPVTIRAAAAPGAAVSDWPPFHSDKVPEVFILSAPESASDSESRADPDSSSHTVVELIVRRLQGVRLGTNDAALAARWPDNFEGASPAGRINSFLMKRTRQFVLLLSNGLLSWLRDEAELQCEFQAFLAANSFRRRLLVVQVGQVDSRSRARYRALANQRLDGGESGSATNWYDMSAEDCDVEALGLWLDGVLYKKADLRK